ncbi:tRNA lysidine(34) synthetase TilS [Desulfovibrio sp.]|uniref:tRNA lysidine(34) synthetase TilS n=1 Tax=Desulfovibrio sp. TaxID=885 RepID=UPI0023BB70CE|nr:tRNA lysidine(34) synthetase TilS [Desulfovibrio sp.]MDE7240727.1 tRNA lysidine(34) synthetase TilS [Desulfovibrio sp.]
MCAEAGPSFPPTLPTLRQLSPAEARLCLGIERFCRRALGLAAGSRLLLALSGGADSTALACLLRLLASRLELTLFALCLDHALRPESAEDGRHVEALCRWLGIPCAVFRQDVAACAKDWGCGLEDAGRKARYALLEEERQAVDADWIVLGHHAGDLAEDVLLRLTRGASWPALAGMAAKDEGRRLLRPLLFTDPEALRGLLRALGIGWREDASNQSRAFRRNRLRHEVLPLLRRENPSLDRSFVTLHELGELDGDFWEGLLTAALIEHPWREIRADDGPGLLLPRELLAGLHPAARLRLYVRALRALGKVSGARGQARGATLLALDEALRQGRGNTCFQLPGGMEAMLRRGSIIFKKSPHSPRSRARPALVTPSTSRP